MRHLLEGGTYSDLSVSGAALVRGWCVFETQFIFEEKRYIATQINFLLRQKWDICIIFEDSITA